MKAKEYIAMCEGLTLKSDTKLLVAKTVEVYNLFKDEFGDKLDERGIYGMTGVISEFDTKWKAIASKVVFLDSEMFRNQLQGSISNINRIMMWK